MQVIQYSPDLPTWQAYVAHLKNCAQAQWVLDEQNQPKFDEMILLGVAQEGAVIASLTLRVQPIVIPATKWAGGSETTLKDADGEVLKETFVQTFHVDESYRRRGIGEKLQCEGLAYTKKLGCYQMRSWSSLNRDANYRLKLKLGFAAHPEVQQTESGLEVSGIYFVKVV